MSIRQLLFLWIFFFSFYSPLSFLYYHCMYFCILNGGLHLLEALLIYLHSFSLFIFWHAWSSSVYHQLTYSFFCQFISTYKTPSKYYFSFKLFIFQLHNFFCCFFMNSISVLIFSTWCDIATMLPFISLIIVPLIP